MSNNFFIQLIPVLDGLVAPNIIIRQDGLVGNPFIILSVKYPASTLSLVITFILDNKSNFSIPITLSEPKNNAPFKSPFFSSLLVETFTNTVACNVGFALDMTVILQFPASTPITMPFLSTIAIFSSLDTNDTVLSVASDGAITGII